ncbi:hypothetical protein CBL_05338 [Carabus blaptoides fortunei]
MSNVPAGGRALWPQQANTHRTTPNHDACYQSARSYCKGRHAASRLAAVMIPQFTRKFIIRSTLNQPSGGVNYGVGVRSRGPTLNLQIIAGYPWPLRLLLLKRYKGGAF